MVSSEGFPDKGMTRQRLSYDENTAVATSSEIKTFHFGRKLLETQDVNRG